MNAYSFLFIRFFIAKIYIIFVMHFYKHPGNFF